MADQLSFDLGGQAAPAAEHPGQLPFNQWAKSRSTVFHASHRADWQQVQTGCFRCQPTRHPRTSLLRVTCLAVGASGLGA
jgi:hypothetical protein